MVVMLFLDRGTIPLFAVSASEDDLVVVGSRVSQHIHEQVFAVIGETILIMDCILSGHDTFWFGACFKVRLA